MRTIDLSFSVAFSVLALGAAVGWVVTGHERLLVLNLGALTLSLLYRIAAGVDELRKERQR